MKNFFNAAVIYISVLAFTFSQTMPAYAGVVGTGQIMNQQHIELERGVFLDYLYRDEAQMLLEKHGVTFEQAQERVGAMTEQEVQQFVQHFEEQPAAGDVGVIAAVLIIVLLLLALDLSGKTDVFSGVN